MPRPKNISSASEFTSEVGRVALADAGISPAEFAPLASEYAQTLATASAIGGNPRLTWAAIARMIVKRAAAAAAAALEPAAGPPGRPAKA